MNTAFPLAYAVFTISFVNYKINKTQIFVYSQPPQIKNDF